MFIQSVQFETVTSESAQTVISVRLLIFGKPFHAVLPLFASFVISVDMSLTTVAFVSGVTHPLDTRLWKLRPGWAASLSTATALSSTLRLVWCFGFAAMTTLPLRKLNKLCG